MINKNVYGIDDIDGFAKSVETSLTFKAGGPALVVISMLSDAQEELQFNADQARQTINRAKFILNKYIVEPDLVARQESDGLRAAAIRM